MANRTFGWIQNPSSTETLRNVVSLFVPDSEFCEQMLQHRLPLLAANQLFKNPSMLQEFHKILRSKSRQKSIKYDILKGQGSGGGSRKNAKCSGLVQAAIDGQQFREYIINGKKQRIKKPYTDDWTADGFLRWAISIGLLDYDYSNDTCSITNLGRQLVMADSEVSRKAVLCEAFLLYPPVYRILDILIKSGHSTKFEIGAKLGFTDEEGFTSIPQNIWVQMYCEALDSKERSKIRSNVEGSSDKYARMIAHWLEEVGWVKKTPKEVVETIGGKTYSVIINQAYEITKEGKENFIKHYNSDYPRKIVYREMLASKAPNIDYLRNRRTWILEFLKDHQSRSLQEIIAFLSTKNINDSYITILDDLKGLINIGVDIRADEDRFYLNDDIIKLIPFSGTIYNTVTSTVQIKERVRSKLESIDHKYLTLIDYAYSGKNSCMDFEIYTIDLFVNELKFQGQHLGGSNKPDGIIYDSRNGTIIDNKAYSKGFTITRHMADEMIRYLQDNNVRNPQINPNEWWKNFPPTVSDFNFIFISSQFKGEVNSMLANIKNRTGNNGGALDVESLLYMADDIKKGVIDKSYFFNATGQNKEVTYIK